MSDSLAELEAQALKLSPEERALLVHRLIESVWESQRVEEAWASEVERRCVAIDNGEEELLNATEIVQSLRRQIS
jgi:putative addiction module component (TIGR02574 family)